MPELGFVACLLATVAALAAVVVTGKSHRRRAHVAFVGVALVGLGASIAFALRLGELYDLEAAGPITPVHLALAKVTTAALLLPIATGALHWNGRVPRRVHASVAWLALLLVAVTTVTGTWMILAAERLP